MNVATELALRLDASVLRVIALLRSRGSTGAPETRVLVVPYCLLGQSAENIVLFAAQTLYPAMHIVKHLPLDLRVAVMEFRVKAVTCIPGG